MSTDKNNLYLNDIPQIIQLDYSITYIGIGSSCHMLWEQSNDQQYPHEIRMLKNYVEELRVNLILIDPEFRNEFPPLCVKNLNAQPDQIYKNVYHTKNNIDIYIFCDKVTYIPDYTNLNIPDGIDITNFFEQMNIICACNDSVLIVNDYSGLEINILALYFDNMIDKKHIMYDMSGRVGIGCFCDFENLFCPVRLTNNDIELINPFAVESSIFMNIFTKQTDTRAIRYFRICANYYKDTFVNMYFHNFRRAKLWKMSNVAHDDNENIHKRNMKIKELRMLDHLHNTKLVQTYEQDNPEMFLREIAELFTQKNLELCQTYHKNPCDIFKVLLLLDHPNQWTDNISQYVKMMVI